MIPMKVYKFNETKAAINLRMPTSVHQALKTKAREEDKSINSVILDLIESGLKSTPKRRAK